MVPLAWLALLSTCLHPSMASQRPNLSRLSHASEVCSFTAASPRAGHYDAYILLAPSSYLLSQGPIVVNFGGARQAQRCERKHVRALEHMMRRSSSARPRTMIAHSHTSPGTIQLDKKISRVNPLTDLIGRSNCCAQYQRLAPEVFPRAFIDTCLLTSSRDTVRAAHYSASQDHRVLCSLALLIFTFSGCSECMQTSSLASLRKCNSQVREPAGGAKIALDHRRR